MSIHSWNYKANPTPCHRCILSNRVSHLHHHDRWPGVDLLSDAVQASGFLQTADPRQHRSERITNRAVAALPTSP